VLHISIIIFGILNILIIFSTKFMGVISVFNDKLSNNIKLMAPIVLMWIRMTFIIIMLVAFNYFCNWNSRDRISAGLIIVSIEMLVMVWEIIRVIKILECITGKKMKIFTGILFK